MYTKAITAFITSAAGMLAVLGLDLNIPPELVGAIAVVVNTVLVYALPNAK